MDCYEICKLRSGEGARFALPEPAEWARTTEIQRFEQDGLLSERQDKKFVGIRVINEKQLFSDDTLNTSLPWYIVAVYSKSE